MQEILLLGVLTVVSFVLGIVGIVLGAIKKKYGVLAGGIVLILVGIGLIPYTTYVAVDKTKAKFEEFVQGRPEIDVYSGLFGEPDSCVTVLESQDAIMPKIDPSIWIHASICPSELERIVSQGDYSVQVQAIDSINPPAVPEHWDIPPSEFDSLIIYEIEYIEGRSWRTLWVTMDTSRMIVQDVFD